MSKVVALEITPQAIRAAEISGHKSKKPKLLRVGEVKLEDGITGESSVIDIAKFADSLKTLWAKSKFTTKTVGVVISGRRFIVRPHTTGHTSLDILRNVLPYEAPGAFPEQVSNLLFDFYPTHEVATKAGIRTEGLVISSPSDSINEIALGLDRAKLDLEYVEFAPLAVSRWVRNNLEGENYVIVNIRDESTDIVLVERGMPRMIRVVSKGLSPNRRKFRGETDEEHLLRRDVIGDSGIKILVQDIGMTIQSQMDEGISSIECIYISGPRAEDSSLIAMLEENFEVPAKPLAITTIDETDEYEENNIQPRLDAFVAMCGGMR